MTSDIEVKSNINREKIIWDRRHLIVSPIPMNMKNAEVGMTAKFDYKGVRFKGVPITYVNEYENEVWLCLSDAEYKFFSDEYYRVYGSK